MVLVENSDEREVFGSFLVEINEQFVNHAPYYMFYYSTAKSALNSSISYYVKADDIDGETITMVWSTTNDIGTLSTTSDSFTPENENLPSLTTFSTSLYANGNEGSVNFVVTDTYGSSFSGSFTVNEYVERRLLQESSSTENGGEMVYHEETTEYNTCKTICGQQLKASKSEPVIVPELFDIDMKIENGRLSVESTVVPLITTTTTQTTQFVTGVVSDSNIYGLSPICVIGFFI